MKEVFLMNITSFLIYCIIITFTPGPTNIAILSTVHNFGTKKAMELYVWSNDCFWFITCYFCDVEYYPYDDNTKNFNCYADNRKFLYVLSRLSNLQNGYIKTNCKPLADHGNLLHAPDMYMEKIAVGRKPLGKLILMHLSLKT